ncbi:MAG: hypothetical protein PHD72_04530, partial [Patescibacteria group bacterium]|nr:hypothetical protein [Patescibacteria group bacterium]
AAQISGSSELGVDYTLSENCYVVGFDISDDGGTTWVVASTTVSGDIGLNQTAGAKNFHWNAGTDYPGQERNDLKIRMWAEDYFGNRSAYTAPVIFAIDTNAPSFSNVAPEQTLGSNIVVITYNLTDTSATDTVYLDISSDGGITWVVPTTSLSGSFGPNIVPGNHRTITWDAGVDFIGQDKSNMRVRLRAIDGSGNSSISYESSDFFVDTLAPTGLSGFAFYSITTTAATLNWSSGLADSHFNRFEIWHGTTRNDVLGRINSAQKWSTADDAGLNSIDTVSTIVTGLNMLAVNYFKIWAIDDYGNETTAGDINGNTTLPIVNYDLTIQTPDGSGSTSPATGVHTYSENTGVDITATPASGWVFDHWTLDGSSGGSINPLTLAMGAAHTLKAVFTEFVSPPTQKVLTISASTGGTTNPTVGAHSYNVGTVVTATETPDSGYDFVRWEKNGAPLSTSSSVDVVVDADMTVTAIFEVTPVYHNLTIQASTGSGSVSPAVGSHSYLENTSVDITATPASGWMLDHWILDGSSSGSISPLTVVMNSVHTVKAVFTEV